MKWFNRFINTWADLDSLDMRIKSIETDIINKRVDEANQATKPPAVTIEDDQGTPWFTIRE